MGRTATLLLLFSLACCSLNMKGTWTIPPEDVAGADDEDRDGTDDTGPDREDLSADDQEIDLPAEPLPDPGEDVGPGEEREEPPADLPADIEREEPQEDALDVPEALDEDIISTDAAEEIEAIACGDNRIQFEAEDMAMVFFLVLDDPRVGRYITDAAGYSAVASIELDIPCAGDWVMWGNVHWFEGDSFYWAWDDPTSTLAWHLLQQCGEPRVDEWRWDQVSGAIEDWNCANVGDDPAVVSLTAGPHTFYLLGREPFARVDRFIFTDNLSWTGP